MFTPALSLDILAFLAGGLVVLLWLLIDNAKADE